MKNLLLPFSFSFCLAALLTAQADGPADNIETNVRRVPPIGIQVPDKDRQEIQQGLDTLAKEIDGTKQALAKKPELLALLPDVQIYHKAVRYALTYQEVHKTNEIALAKQLLQQGTNRAKQLREGKPTWTNATGLVVRSFESRIDGSVQPYGLVVPEAAKTGLPLRLDIWFHGRGEVLNEMNFINDRQRNAGQFTPPNTIVLHVYNRYCNPARFAGETDVFEALAHVKKFYAIDENRILVRGFSMGGASCWNFAVHHPDLWAGAQPGAGFSEAAEFLRFFQSETLKPYPWESKLWRWHDATEHAINLFNVPTVAYSGEKDKQKQAADLMEQFAAKEGIRLTHIIGPNTEHKFEPNAKLEVEKRMDAIAARGRNPVPRQVKYATFTLRYNKAFWITIDGLEQHWERGFVDAEFETGESWIKVDTKNLTALTVSFDAGEYPLNITRPARVILDGQTIETPKAFSDRSFSASFRKDGKRWKLITEAASGLVKKHGLQGPIDDAFMDSFMFVQPSGTAMNAKVDQWVKSELDHAVTHWRQQFRGDARLKKDTEITDADIAQHNLVLWGDPQSNALLAKIADKLPIKWTKQGLWAGALNHSAETHVPVLIYPNPLNPKKYVVINSSFTYREYDYLNNARQTPKLPDWAVVDISKPATSRWPGGIVEAGFFGERWELPPRK
ncbi:MAG TPA: prolyl oligopeptidase family serine peptidase [Verrucomicrobiae bacterium]